MHDEPEQHAIEHARRWYALGDELRRRLGPGSGLDPNVRGRFEGRLGGDLSGAMVHRSPLAGHLARAFGAQAEPRRRNKLGNGILPQCSVTNIHRFGPVHWGS